ncbi:glycosyltransferase family 2 protein, partial [Serratia marcescens]
MKGSVAIILRHHETRKRLLLRALESVKNQSYKKYEVFVMMSKFNISSDIEDLVLISGCENVNIVDSQNELINKLHSTQFEYVCFLD